MKFSLLKPFKLILNKLNSLVLLREFKNQKYSRYNERPVEYGFVFKKLAELAPRNVLDVGTGTSALPHLIMNCGAEVDATDNIKDYWPRGLFNRHFWIINDSITESGLSKKYELITCISTLEHIIAFDDAIKNMVRLLADGGSLILTFPFTDNEYIQNCYELEDSAYGQGNAYITQSFNRKTIKNWCEEFGLKIEDQEYWKYWTGDYWTQGTQIIPPIKSRERENYQLTCLHLSKL